MVFVSVHISSKLMGISSMNMLKLHSLASWAYIGNIFKTHFADSTNKASEEGEFLAFSHVIVTSFVFIPCLRSGSSKQECLSVAIFDLGIEGYMTLSCAALWIPTNFFVKKKFKEVN